MENSQILQRVEIIRKDLSKSKKEFCDSAGISSNYYSQILSGGKKLPLEYVMAIGEKFDVNLNWLLLGKKPEYIFNENNFPPFTEEELNKLCEKEWDVSDFDKIKQKEIVDMIIRDIDKPKYMLIQQVFARLNLGCFIAITANQALIYSSTLNAFINSFLVKPHDIQYKELPRDKDIAIFLNSLSKDERRIAIIILDKIWRMAKSNFDISSSIA